METTTTSPRYPAFARAVALVGHPIQLAGVFGLWWALGRSDKAMYMALAATLLVSMTLERLIPAVPAWRQGLRETLPLVGLYVLGMVLYNVILIGYLSALPASLSDVHARIGNAIWPSAWPLPVQALLLFFASDFLYYWAHRAIHRWSPVWRISGHGFHHAFQNLHTINAGTNHPFELVFLAIPTVLLAAVFGPPDEALIGAGLLVLANASMAHANVRMETPLFNWIFTSSDQHRLHHSAVFEDSNTNYACNAILWDRLFGTYRRGEVLQTGVGPTQPALWRMFLMPFHEPKDADTVATRQHAPG